MMPLILADSGSENIVRKVGGTAEVKQHLADLGFNVGTPVTVVAAIGGNVIVKVKESRVAISREMAQKIMV
ncbi:MAG: ferrous iron transport protein A [Ruminococcaceae bacterium]|nr:ferrous iron transport protein A [Oscillospiraceae bacterium]